LKKKIYDKNKIKLDNIIDYTNIILINYKLYYTQE
jgi:hypothetical protein